MNCNDTMTFLKEYNRMCKTHGNCNGCPADGWCNGGFELVSAVTRLEIVQKWSDEHPPKTYMQDFLKRFPNARLSEYEDRPMVCRIGVYGGGNCPQCGCTVCWNEPMEEEK